ncbi:MAG: hypothetical protein V1743_00445 [Nanoarchaeota archaeon]
MERKDLEDTLFKIQYSVGDYLNPSRFTFRRGFLTGFTIGACYTVEEFITNTPTTSLDEAELIYNTGAFTALCAGILGGLGYLNQRVLQPLSGKFDEYRARQDQRKRGK